MLYPLGIGSVKVKLTTSGSVYELTLSNVLHVPDLKKNLLSTRKLAQLGFQITIDDHKAVVTNLQCPQHSFSVLYTRDMLVAPMIAQEATEQAILTQSAGYTLLELHQRLGHIGN